MDRFHGTSIVQNANGALIGGCTFECTMCSRKFFRRGDLNNHIKSMHFRTKTSNTSKFIKSENQNIEKPQICPACSEVFLDETSLSKHLLDSHKSSMHECSLCPKKFSSESGLKYHLKSKHFMNTQPPEINVKQDFCEQEETSNHYVKGHFFLFQL